MTGIDPIEQRHLIQDALTPERRAEVDAWASEYRRRHHRVGPARTNRDKWADFNAAVDADQHEKDQHS